MTTRYPGQCDEEFTAPNTGIQMICRLPAGHSGDHYGEERREPKPACRLFACSGFASEGGLYEA